MTVEPLLAGYSRVNTRRSRGNLHNSTHPSVHDLDADAPTPGRSSAGEMAVLAMQFESVQDPTVMLQLITARGRQLISGSRFAALQCRSQARWSTLAAADISSHRYAALQVAFNETCSMAAPSRGEAGQSDSTTLEVRAVIPDSQLAQLGVSHIMIAPIGLPQTVLGTFNWYLSDMVSDDVLDAARWFSRHASAAYLHARERRELVEAAESRGVIGQAQGILMATLGLTADAAFAALRRLSQDGNVKLHRVAIRVVNTGLLPSDLETAPPPANDVSRLRTGWHRRDGA